VIGGDDYIRLCNLVVFDQTTTVPPHLLEFELALDVFPGWKGWFDSDLQRLVNYLAATFEAVNAILMRDAGVRVKITHVQVWDSEEPLAGERAFVRLVRTWESGVHRYHGQARGLPLRAAVCTATTGRHEACPYVSYLDI
jgi:hypothetical protein